MEKGSAYTPPFRVTDEMMSLVADIAEAIGQLSATTGSVPTPQLRKQNRIKTIQSSLAIENNSMSIEQVTAILEGRRVLGAPNEIQEVKNAIDAYELLLELNPYKEKDLLRAHRLLMTDLVKENGRYRQGGVGVFDGKRCLHMAPPAMRVPLLMSDLLQWAKKTKVHPLISSCVFHYEFEFIHPFADGNGRMGRMWQTLLLMQWKPIFAWIPVETIVKENQQEYYDAIAQSDKESDSTSFVEFMLKCLLAALREMQESNPKSSQKSDQKILDAMRESPNISIRELQERLGMSESGVKKVIRQLRESGLVQRIGGAKGGHWAALLSTLVAVLFTLTACDGKKVADGGGEVTTTEVQKGTAAEAQEVQDEIAGIVRDLYAAAGKNEEDMDARFACHRWRETVKAVDEKDAELGEIGFFNEDYWTDMQDSNPDDFEVRDLQFEQLDTEKGTAVVSFVLYSSVQTIKRKFVFCHEDGEWCVHDIIKFLDIPGTEEEAFSYQEGMQDYLDEPAELGKD